MTIIEQSRFLAMGAHYGINHKRKYTGEPYFQHLENVAKIVAFNGGTDEMIAAAYLHDILEDTKFPPSSLFQIIGERVFDMVLAPKMVIGKKEKDPNATNWRWHPKKCRLLSWRI